MSCSINCNKRLKNVLIDRANIIKVVVIAIIKQYKQDIAFLFDFILLIIAQLKL